MAEAEFFPGRLRELREASGLTQDQLAERVGVKRDAIARWEAGIGSRDGQTSWPWLLHWTCPLMPSARNPPAARNYARPDARRRSGREGGNELG